MPCMAWLSVATRSSKSRGALARSRSEAEAHSQTTKPLPLGAHIWQAARVFDLAVMLLGLSVCLAGGMMLLPSGQQDRVIVHRKQATWKRLRWYSVGTVLLLAGFLVAAKGVMDFFAQSSWAA